MRRFGKSGTYGDAWLAPRLFCLAGRNFLPWDRLAFANYQKRLRYVIENAKYGALIAVLTISGAAFAQSNCTTGGASTCGSARNVAGGRASD
jgi:hypothetical protein